MNKIFKAIIYEEARKFVESFSNTAKTIFVNKNGKIYHNGEYGMYREAVCKEFLKSFTPTYLDINQGFIITPDDRVSTQCDILIYDKENTPMIQSGEKQRFFPIETVVGIGEIKSTLSKSDLKKAINKLARNKALRDFSKPTKAIRIDKSVDDKNFNHPYNNIFSFLICEKLDFKLDNINEVINELYDNDIEYKFRHNVILSLKDGIIMYNDGKKNYYIPIIGDEKLDNVLDTNNIHINQHIFGFCHLYYMALESVTVFYPEFVSYLSP